MKNIFKLLLIIIVVAAALSFKNLGQGKVYCTDLCFFPSRVDYMVDEFGTEFDPCENGFGGEYMRDPVSTLCVPVPASAWFSPTPL